MDENNKKSGQDNTDTQSVDSWDSIKQEFNNILQNQFNIDPEKPEEYQATSFNSDDLPATLMQNGIGFSSLQNAILKNIDNTEEKPEGACKEKSWDGLASSLINEHSYLLQEQRCDADTRSGKSNQQEISNSLLSESAYPHPYGSTSRQVQQFTPFSVNLDNSLPFNPASISNLEESIQNIHASSSGSTITGWQGEIYNSLSLMNNYYQSYYRLQGVLARTIPMATLIFKERVTKEIPENDNKSSITDLYYMWLDSCELAYIDITSTEEFAICLGNLINTYSELKLTASGFSENVSSFTGLPSQQDLDSSYHEQYILRKQQQSIQEDLHSIQHQRELDNKVNAAKIDTLSSEIEILKKQISQLKGLLDGPNNNSEPVDKSLSNEDSMH